MNRYRPRRPVGTPGVGKTPDIHGVYCLINRRNGRVYVGQSTEVYTRLNTHVGQLINGYHHNKALQADWTAFGGAAFEFNILVTTADHSPLSLPELERIFFRVYQSENPVYGYNVSPALQTANAHAKTRKASTP